MKSKGSPTKINEQQQLSYWAEQCEAIGKGISELPEYKLFEKDKVTIRAIGIEPHNSPEEATTIVPIRNADQSQGQPPMKNANAPAMPQGSDWPETPGSIARNIPAASSHYLTMDFGLDRKVYQDMGALFDLLRKLPPMDKHGMSGKCDAETTQMEQFLYREFGFANIPHQNIVDGVRSFRLGRPPHTLPKKTLIHFPSSSESLFKMTVAEILKWQQSYAVYTDKRVVAKDKDFLNRVLRGLSTDGAEAFCMKFVVRISTCPILMEFDARVIKRELNDKWPGLIKMVSVTGIDFAGRKHDVDDIRVYISNWKEVYEVDQKKDQPLLANSRDFRQRRGGPKAILHQDYLLSDLKQMARLRLRACDNEGVQVVVETGIGLGVFAGRSIGIERTVQTTSAMAIKTVLEEDGSTYKNIRAVVFALPIFGQTQTNDINPDCFRTFVEEFEQPQYKGPIPVLIADQDMHRLTVAIARQGLRVSQLNPADSHGVFGEYWQNRGPAVEEKLALTTLGLLVQHHLINPEVTNPARHHLLWNHCDSWVNETILKCDVNRSSLCCSCHEATVYCFVAGKNKTNSFIVFAQVAVPFLAGENWEICPATIVLENGLFLNMNSLFMEIAPSSTDIYDSLSFFSLENDSNLIWHRQKPFDWFKFAHSVQKWCKRKYFFLMTK